MTPPLSAVADASASHRAQRPSISSRGVIRASSARNLVACGNTNQSTLTLPPQPGSSVQNSPLFHPSPSPSALSTGAPEKSVSRTPQASRQQSTHGPAAMLAEEAEEISRTHGQLGSVRLMFTVQDTGIGIPAEYMSALFEPYSQAKRSITRSVRGVEKNHCAAVKFEANVTLSVCLFVTPAGRTEELGQYRSPTDVQKDCDEPVAYSIVVSSLFSVAQSRPCHREASRRSDER